MAAERGESEEDMWWAVGAGVEGWRWPLGAIAIVLILQI
jgi:hypothetical protein